MKYHLLRTIFSISIVGGAVLGLSGNAVADTKVFLGTLCVEQNDTTPEITYNGFKAWNSAGGNNTFQCPVIRDVMAGDITDWVVAYDRNGNTTDAWTLTLLSCDANGSTCFSDPETVPLTDGPLEVDGEAVNNFESYGGVTIESSVPPDCEIHSYRIVEA